MSLSRKTEECPSTKKKHLTPRIKLHKLVLLTTIIAFSVFIACQFELVKEDGDRKTKKINNTEEGFPIIQEDTVKNYHNGVSDRN